MTDRPEREIFWSTEYLGTHPSFKRKASGPLTFSEGGIDIPKGFKPHRVPWSEVTALDVTDGEDSSRFTATRIAALGPFALAAKKHKHSALVVISTTDGDFLVEVSKMTAVELRARLTHYIKQVETTAPTPPVMLADAAEPPAEAQSSPDAMGQLRQLGELHDAGVLTDEEFGAKKAELLSRL
jgi:hypothetical protein